MKYVTLTHDKMPDREIEVAEAGVHEYEKSGWARKEGTEREVAVDTVPDSEQGVDDSVPQYPSLGQ